MAKDLLLLEDALQFIVSFIKVNYVVLNAVDNDLRKYDLSRVTQLLELYILNILKFLVYDKSRQ